MFFKTAFSAPLVRRHWRTRPKRRGLAERLAGGKRSTPVKLGHYRPSRSEVEERPCGKPAGTGAMHEFPWRWQCCPARLRPVIHRAG